MGRAGERLGRAGKHPGEDTTNVSFDVCPCRVRTRSSGCVVQSPDSWKGAETCSCRREEAGRCPWWHGQTDKVPQGIRQPPQPLPSHISSTGPSSQFMGGFALWPSPSSCWSRCLCRGKSQPCPASLLTQTLADPGAGLSVNPCVGHGWGLAGARHWGAAKEGGLVGMDTEVCYGDSGGARFSTPNTPCPVQRPMREAMGACVGQWGCAGAGTGHRLEP